MALVFSDRFVSASGNYEYDRRYIYLISTVAALGGLLFGYDIANISGTIRFFTRYFELSDLNVGWAVGCLSLGAAFGAMISGRLSDYLGRKKILIFSAFLFAVTGVGTGWANDFAIFIIFRILSGVAIGCATVVCPIYIAEISPAHFRGRLVSYYQLAITFGVLLAYLSNYLLLGTGDNNWRWMFTSQSVPAVFFLAGMFFVVESPRWLVMKNREQEARQMLERVGGSAFADAEVSSIHESFASKEKSGINVLFSKKMLRIVNTGICLAIFSQIGGPFTAYGPEIFGDAGVAQNSAFLQSVIVGATLFLFTIIAIATVEKAGRRKLLLYGSIFLLIDTVAVTLAFQFHLAGVWVLVFALLYMAVYAATVGPVSWVVLSEIFPNRIRGSAMSLATLALWVANFLNTASFPVIRSTFGMPMAFGVYVPLFVLFVLFVFIRIPETKGKTLEEIEQMLTEKK